MALKLGNVHSRCERITGARSNSPARRVGFLGCLLSLIIFSITCIGRPTRFWEPAEAECDLARTALVGDGIIWYLLPQSISAGADRMLVAGAYSQGFRTDDSGRITTVTDSVIVAAVFGRGDVVPVPIASPLPRRNIGLVRTAFVDRDEWAFLFAETRRPPGEEFPDHVVGLWAARYRAGEWAELHQIPIPSSENLELITSSQLLLWHDTLIWAARTWRIIDGTIFVFMGARESWSSARLPVDYPTYARTAASYEGLFVAAAQMERSGGHKLTVFRRMNGWAEITRFEDDRIFDPMLSVSGDSLLAVWSQQPANGVPHNLRAQRWPNAKSAQDMIQPERPASWWPIQNTAEILLSRRSGLFVREQGGTIRHLPILDHFIGDLVVTADSKGDYWLAAPIEADAGVPTVGLYFVSQLCTQPSGYSAE